MEKLCIIGDNASSKLFTALAILAFSFAVFSGAATAFSGGNGSSGDPYQITNWTELNETRNNLSAHYELQNDLDETTAGYTDLVATTNGWDPIGDDSNAFTGTFYGNEYEISDLYINRSETSDVGLFGYVENGAEVTNVGVIDANISGDGDVGGLIGENYGSDVSNSYSTGNVTGDGYVGGLIGYLDNGDVSDSSSTGDVTGNRYMVGGLIGGNWKGNIDNSSSTGNVTGSGNEVGGLIGWNGGGDVTNSSSTGNVTGSGNEVGGLIGDNSDGGNVSDSSSTGNVTGSGSDVGGLIGLNTGGGDVSDSSSDGDVESTGSDVGGLIGDNYNGGDVVNSSSTGDVESTEDGEVGGLIGGIGGSDVINSSSTGNVTGNDGFVGGLIGENIGGNVSNSSSTGDVTGAGDYRAYVGGLIGYNGEGSIVSDSHSEGNIEGSSEVGGLIGENYGDDVSNSYSIGNVTGGGSNVGGLIGLSNGNVSNSYSEGDVEGASEVGGLVGDLEADNSVSNSYSTSDVTGSGDNVGGLIGINHGDFVNNSSSSGNVEGKGYQIGGLIGYNEGDISDSSANGIVIGHGEYDVGGLIGYNSGGEVTSSYSIGNVTGKGDEVGGLIGGSDSSISDSYSEGNVEGNGEYIGGLIGYIEDSSVSDSYAKGNVTGNKGYVGGLIGYLKETTESSVTRSYSSGNVLGNKTDHYGIGGLIGWSQGDVNNSYSTANVEGYNDVGGLIGGSNGDVYYSYSTGIVVGNAEDGGLVGWTEGSVSSSYWNTGTSGLTTSDGGEGRTTNEMTYEHTEEKDTFYDYDKDVWNLGDHITVEDHEGNTGYPALSWQEIEEKERPVHNIDKNESYVTIQDAIEDASEGNTIEVSNGTYEEKINVTQSLTLEGESNAGTVIEGGFNVTSENTTITNFNITTGYEWDPGAGKEGAYRAGIYATSSNNNFYKNNFNKISGGDGDDAGRDSYGSGGDGGDGVGIYLQSSTDNNISFNQITSISGGKGGDSGGRSGTSGSTGGVGAGIYLQKSTDNTISSNQITDISGGRGGVSRDGASGGTGGIGAGIYFQASTSNTVSSNQITDISGGRGGAHISYTNGADQKGYGIYMDESSLNNQIDASNQMEGDPIIYLYNESHVTVEGHKLEAEYNPTNYGKIAVIQSTNVTIHDNVIANTTGSSGETDESWRTAEDGSIGAGIYLQESTINNISSNQITDISGGEGGGAEEESNGGDGGVGAGVYIQESTDNNISSNQITDISGGEGGGGGFDSSGGTDGVGASIYLDPSSDATINYNNLEGGQDVGVYAENIQNGPINATYNYWGQPQKPSDRVEGDVEYTPWYANEAMVENVRVIRDGKPVALSDTIQGGVDAAESGDTVEVGPGTYGESVTINKSLTLESTEGSEEAKIDASEHETGLEVKTSNVTVDGFEIEGAKGTYSGIEFIMNGRATSDITIKNNYIQGMTLGCDHVDCSIGDRSAYGVQASGASGIEGIVLENNTIRDIGSTDCSRGFGVRLGNLTGNSTIVRNNRFRNIQNGYYEYSDPDVGACVKETTVGTGLGVHSESATAEVTGNSFSNISRDISVRGNVSNTDIHENNFGDGNATGVYAYNIENGTVNATYNYWGDETGPGGVGSGEGDNVSENVSYTPWYPTEDMIVAIWDMGEDDSEAEGTIEENRNLTTENASVEFGENTVVTSSPEWNFKIKKPAIRDGLSEGSTEPSSPDKETNIDTVVEVGADVQLNLSLPAKTVIEGESGSNVGWTRPGEDFHDIDTGCKANFSNATEANDSLTHPAECKVDDGDNLVIWTTHFTEFVTYSESEIDSGGGDDGGGDGGGGGTGGGSDDYDGSGGGGISGGTSEEKVDTTPNKTVRNGVVSIKNIHVGENGNRTISVNSSDTGGLTKIEIQSGEGLVDGLVDMEPAEGVEVSEDEITLSSTNITHRNLINLTSARLTFRLSMDTLNSYNATPENVSVWRNDDGWTEISSTLVSETDDEAVFEVETDGFSVYALTVDRIQQDSGETSDTSEDETGDEETDTGTTGQLTGQATGIVVALIMVILSAAGLLYYRHRKES